MILLIYSPGSTKMGSRPTRVRSVEIRPDENGSMSKVINELQTENAQLKTRLNELEKNNSETLLKENERLKKQNEGLRNELIKMKDSLGTERRYVTSVPVKKNSDLSVGNGHLHDTLSDNINLTPSPTIDRRIHSDRSSSPGYSSCKTSPNVNDGRKRKIDPSSILQRMSDIDAYGQGLPLADSSLMVKTVRRTRHRKRKPAAGKDESPTNSEGTTSPAEVLPSTVRSASKPAEEGQTDSGVHSTDADHREIDHHPEPNDILMT